MATIEPEPITMTTRAVRRRRLLTFAAMIAAGVVLAIYGLMVGPATGIGP